MNDEEIGERIRQARKRDHTKQRIGRHTVLIDTIRLPAGEVTTVHRLLDGQVTVVRAGADSFRDVVVEALLEVPAVATGAIQPIAIDLPGTQLNRAIVLGSRSALEADPELDQRTVTVVAAHHSEILPGEAENEFHNAISSHGTGLSHHLNDWNRQPVPRADTRLLDQWPGGMMRRSTKYSPWQAERVLNQIVPAAPADVRVEIRDTRGDVLVLRRRWDRVAGTMTFPDGGSIPIDLPRRDLWEALGRMFLTEDLSGLVTTSPGTPEEDILEMRYQTADRGWVSLPVLESLGNCAARLDRHILRTPGNWAVFTSRSNAVIQVKCTADGQLWLETPDPPNERSQGRLVTVQQATALLETLAREDRSAVADLPDTETVPWN